VSREGRADGRERGELVLEKLTGNADRDFASCVVTIVVVIIMCIVVLIVAGYGAVARCGGREQGKPCGGLVELYKG
jgi:hypothetical protein